MRPLITTFDYIVYSKDADASAINNFIAKYGYQKTTNRDQAVNSIKAIIRDTNGKGSVMKDLAMIHPDKDLFMINAPIPSNGMSGIKSIVTPVSNADGDVSPTISIPTSGDKPSPTVTTNFFKENQTLLILSATIIAVTLIIRNN